MGKKKEQSTPKHKSPKHTKNILKSKVPKLSSESQDSEEYSLSQQQNLNIQKSYGQSKNRSSQQQQSQEGNQREIYKGTYSIRQFLDIDAQQSSGPEEQSSLDSEAKKNHIQQFKRDEEEAKKKVGTAQQYMKGISQLNQETINDHYKQKLNKLLAEEHQSSEEDLRRKDVQLFQINCRPGLEDELVYQLSNKKKFSLRFPDLYYCSLYSIMATPKKLPGKIFIEAKSRKQIEKSITGLRFLQLPTLKKIEYQVFSHLFGPKHKQTHDFKVKQYVRIKTGRYRQDIGQITKINKNGVTVQVAPRIDFQDIAKRMNTIEVQYRKKNISNSQIVQQKNMRFQQELDPKDSSEGRAPQKKLLPSDFQPFSEFEYTKKIKITSDGLLLVNYLFNEIEIPNTSISPKEIILLNRFQQDREQILKREGVNIKMGENFHHGDRVEIIEGELKGCKGRIENILKKIVKIKCSNKQLRGLIIQEISYNVVKRFKEGDTIIVVDGVSKGQVGQVIQNGTHFVEFVSLNHERIKVNKRDIQLKITSTVNFANDLGLKINDIVTARHDIGIVCDSKKGHIDMVNVGNQIKRYINNEVTKVTNFGAKAFTFDEEQVGRDCLIRVISGPKKGRVLKVKHSYKNYIFLEDPSCTNLFGNWVQKADNCILHVFAPPRIEARFLEDQGIDRHFYKERLYKPKALVDDPIKVGKSYHIKSGAFMGVKGVISATFKTYIQVLVFGNKIQRIDRDKLRI